MGDEDEIDGGWDDVAPARAGEPQVASPPKTPRKTHDMRAPRATRSTKESPHYRPVRDEPPRERKSREAPRETPPREDAKRDLLGPRRPRRHEAAPVEALQRPRDAGRAVVQSAPEPPAPKMAPAPEPKPAPTAERKPKPKPAPAPAPAPAPVAPAPPSLNEDLAVLGARPVTVHKKTQKDKPTTAKEALQMRAARNRAKPGRTAKQRRAPSPKSALVPKAEAEKTAQEDEDDREESPPSSSEPEEVSRKPAGVWAKIKRLFGR